MRTALVIVSLAISTAFAHAEPVLPPTFQQTDTWAYHLSAQANGHVRQSRITISLQRVGSDHIVTKLIDDAFPDRVGGRMYGLDWTVRRSVNGKETIVLQPLSFPLEIGKSWTVKYEEANPSPQKLREIDVHNYRVIGWEDVSVPAGKFHALKIESKGSWTADLMPHLVNNAVAARQGNVTALSTEKRLTLSQRVRGQYYEAFWYVPAIKRWVKSTEESYTSGGDLASATSTELESYTIDGKTEHTAADPAPAISAPTAPAPAAPAANPAPAAKSGSDAI